MISYSAAQRTHEIGVRMTLGAQPRDVLRLILGQVAKLALAGLGIGIVAALLLTRLMASMLYSISATDPVTFIAVAILLLGVALLACYIPARRAMRVDHSWASPQMGAGEASHTPPLPLQPHSAGMSANESGNFSPLLEALDVVSQEVVNIQAGTGHGRTLAQARMRSMPAVAVNPGCQLGEAFGRVLVEPGVGPFADGSLDEAFGFPVGPRGVDTRADRFDAQAPAVGGEAARTKAGSIIGHHTTNRDTQTSKVSHGLTQEAACGDSFFIRQHGGKGDAGMIIDSHVEELPASAACFVLGIAGEAMTRFGNAG